MANPPKQKGTGGETEFVNQIYGLTAMLFRRTAPTIPWDCEWAPPQAPRVVNALATRPDRGRWLVTLTIDDFAAFVKAHPHWEFHVENKRYKRFSLHTIFEKKFGRS